MKAADHARCALMMLCTLVGCAKVRYPKCHADEQCIAHKEVCVQGSCQQCRTDAHCESLYPEQGRRCQEGRCAALGECHNDQACVAAGLAGPCRDGRCVDACQAASDCPAGQACVAGRCRAGCIDDAGCGPGHHCEAGRCAATVPPQQAATGPVLAPACMPPPDAPGTVVNLPPVTFAFNTSELPADTQTALQQAAACLSQAPANLHVVVEGHCDDRGTQEYNLALGQRRAQAVLDYLVRLGVAQDRLEARSKGENEPTCSDASEACYRQNRRAAFVQHLVPGF